MSQVDSYDVLDATDASITSNFSKKKSKLKLLNRKKRKSKKAQIPEEERYVDDQSNSPESFTRVSIEDVEAQNLQTDEKKTGSSKKKSKKEKYRKGVLVATELITVILEHHGEINEDTMNAVLASMLNGKETTPGSAKGQKALKKATKNDRSFVEMAMLAAETVNDMGGSRGEMKTAAASVLACRGLKEYKGFEFERSHLLAIAEAAAQDAVQNSKSIQTRERGYYSARDEDTEDESATDDHITLAVTSFDSIDQIRTGGLKAWRENLGEWISYGFAEALGCLGNQLVNASDKTTKNIEETVINDYLIQNGVESYEIVGEQAEWKPWVSEDVDFVELEARFERYFYTVATAKGTCTLEWPSGKKFLKQKRKYGGRKIASSQEARTEMGI